MKRVLILSLGAFLAASLLIIPSQQVKAQVACKMTTMMGDRATNGYWGLGTPYYGKTYYGCAPGYPYGFRDEFNLAACCISGKDRMHIRGYY